MSDIDAALETAMHLDGAVAIALVDYTSGLVMAQSQREEFDLELAAAVNTEVVRAKLRAIESLRLEAKIEDILITLDSQYHLIRVSQDSRLAGTFTYLVLDRARGNLALARRALAGLDGAIAL